MLGTVLFTQETPHPVLLHIHVGGEIIVSFPIVLANKQCHCYCHMAQWKVLWNMSRDLRLTSQLITEQLCGLVQVILPL